MSCEIIKDIQEQIALRKAHKEVAKLYLKKIKDLQESNNQITEYLEALQPYFTVKGRVDIESDIT